MILNDISEPPSKYTEERWQSVISIRIDSGGLKSKLKDTSYRSS